MENKFYLRVTELRESQHMTQGKFAEALGVSKSAVKAWEYAVNIPTQLMLEKIASTFNVSMKWLKNGYGDMYNPVDENISIIDQSVSGKDAVLRGLLVPIVQHPQGWRLLAEAVVSLTEE